MAKESIVKQWVVDQEMRRVDKLIGQSVSMRRADRRREGELFKQVLRLKDGIGPNGITKVQDVIVRGVIGSQKTLPELSLELGIGSNEVLKLYVDAMKKIRRDPVKNKHYFGENVDK